MGFHRICLPLRSSPFPASERNRRRYRLSPTIQQYDRLYCLQENPPLYRCCIRGNPPPFPHANILRIGKEMGEARDPCKCANAGRQYRRCYERICDQAGTIPRSSQGDFLLRNLGDRGESGIDRHPFQRQPCPRQLSLRSAPGARRSDIEYRGWLLQDVWPGKCIFQQHP